MSYWQDVKAHVQDKMARQEVLQAAASSVNPEERLKKRNTGLAFVIVGGFLFVVFGIPLMQGKGIAKPGLGKIPEGYVPTRRSPGEVED